MRALQVPVADNHSVNRREMSASLSGMSIFHMNARQIRATTLHDTLRVRAADDTAVSPSNSRSLAIILRHLKSNIVYLNVSKLLEIIGTLLGPRDVRDFYTCSTGRKIERMPYSYAK